MAEIIQNEGGGRKRKATFRRNSNHIDMTPMVDLACLLLTFFMLTTAFIKPKVMDIVLPEDGDSSKIIDKRTVNIIVDENDKVYWYYGMVNPKNSVKPTLTASSLKKDEVRNMLLLRNKTLFRQIAQINRNVNSGNIAMPADSLKKRILDLKRNDKSGPIVLIKATDKAKYGNIVDIMDEMAICNIARYTIADLSADEKVMLANAKNTEGIKTF